MEMWGYMLLYIVVFPYIWADMISWKGVSPYVSRLVICIPFKADIKKRMIVIVNWKAYSQLVDLDIFFICPRTIIYNTDFKIFFLAYETHEASQ